MENNQTVLIIDSTLRDGSHAMSHQFNKDNVKTYASAAEKARMPILVVGHGNGLGASSLQLGKSLLTDHEMITIARNELKNTKLAAFLIPGFGTIQANIEPAIADGIDVMIVASHCTEANVTRQHIEYCVKKGIPTYGVLMMSHMISARELLEQAKLMESYGAHGILLMDSAGSYLMQDVKDKISLLAQGLAVPVGFHAHNNLGLGVANSVVAVECGARIIDGTARELGAGAGNCQLEVIIAVLEKMGYNTSVDLYALLDASDTVIAPIMKKPQVIDGVTLVSGLCGVFSGFAPHAIKAANRFNVDVRDILIELGKRKVVGGQEDIIIEVAMQLAQKREKRSENFHLESLT